MAPNRRQFLAMSCAAIASGGHVVNAAPFRGRLRIAASWEIGGLEPNVGGYHFTRAGVLETLVDADVGGRLRPGLASSYAVDSHRRVWRFSLRPAAQFHDGMGVDANWVARMLARARERPGLLGRAPIASIAGDAAQRVVVVTLTQPHALLPSVLAHSSTAILGPSSFVADRVVRIVGSGPYEIDDLTPPQRFSTRLFAGWGGPRGNATGLHYLSVGRAESRALLAQSGQVDVAMGLDPASEKRLARDTRLRIAAVTLPRTTVVKVNAGHKWLRDRAFRRALSHGIDRDGIARALLRAPQLAASELLPPTVVDWHFGLEATRYDAPLARSLLEGLGFRANADGPRTAPNGERLALTLTTYPDRPELPLIATALQEQWRQLGIAVKVALGNSGDIPRGHANGTLELGLIARNYALTPDPVGTLIEDFAAAGDWGAMNWSNPIVATQLGELAAGTARDPSVARREIARVLHDELPVIPVAWGRQVAAVGPDGSRFTLDPYERSFLLDGLTV